MADEVKVLKIDEETAFTDDGKLEQRMRVQFKVGNHGPFFGRFRRKDFPAAPRSSRSRNTPAKCAR
jgi:hypothetical protein